MINPKFQAGNSFLSAQADKQTVCTSQGIHANKVCVQKMVRINPDANQLFTGAFSGLNMPQFAKLGTGICVAKHGYVSQRQQREGVTYVKLGIPVYAAADQIYQGMLFVNLACSGADGLGDHSVVKVVPSLWARAVDDGKNCWVSGLSPAEGEPEYNPFDYAIAQLPSTLNQAASTAICASSLCEFLSEAFRLLTPEDRSLYLGIMLQSNRFSRFLKYAASTRSHHNGDHGLVLHTAETVANVLLGFLAASPWQRSIGKPTINTRIGISYRPKTEFTGMRGKLKIQETAEGAEFREFLNGGLIGVSGPLLGVNGPQAAGDLLPEQRIKQDITLPDELRLSIFHHASPKLDLMASYTRQDFSVTNLKFVRESNGRVLQEIQQNYVAANSYRVGLNYKAFKRLVLKAGYAVENSVIDDDTRITLLPDSDRQYFGLGAQLELRRDTTLNFSYMKFDLEPGATGANGQVSPAEVRGGDFQGTTKLDIDFFGVSITERF